MAITLDELIRAVEAVSDDDLLQLEEAVAKARELDELGDSLLNHFVDRSRRSGHTWAEIGQHLGVTRQAAQKRFVDSAGSSLAFERFTVRARAVVDQAAEAARSLQHNFLGTEHLLLALWSDPEAISTKVLDALGVDRQVITQKVIDTIGRGPVPVAGAVPLTPRAVKALEEAAAAALDLGHGYVGTEHILLGLHRGQDGLAKKLLLEVGATNERIMAKVIELLAGYRTS